MKTNKQLDLTQGSLRKQIFTFSLPLILSNLLQVMFNLVDIAVVGQFAGAMALGSVGSTAILIPTIAGCLMGVGEGVNVMTARYIGSRERDPLRRTVHTSFLVSLLMGCLLMFIGLFYSEGILRLLNTKEELLSDAVLYCKIYFLSLPAIGLYNFGRAVFSAVGDTKRPLQYLTIAGILNVVLNLFFVVVLRMSVAGVAIASVISQYFSAFLVIHALFRLDADYSLRCRELRICPKCAKDVLSIGLPSALQNCIFGLANLFIQTGINSFDAIVVSGISAASNADSIVYNVMAGFYTACASFMGQNYGARNKKRVLQSYCVSLFYSLASGVVLGLLLVFFGRSFLSLFTHETAVIEAGLQRLTILGLSYGASAFMDCTISASRALGKSLVPSIIVVLGSCVFRILWVETVFAHFRTVPSLYLLYCVSWTITAIAELVYFIRIYRQIQFSVQ